jgi:hypothetical protein
MAILVYRIYNDSDAATGQEFIENHFMSIVADESSAQYVFAEDSVLPGLDDSRIADMKTRLWGNEEPSTAKDWAEIAYYRIAGENYVVDTYNSIEEAISGEQAALLEAKEEREDLNDDEGFEETDEELLVFEEEEDEEDSKAITAAVGECPPATQDIALNLKNRKNAIDTAMYGPLNPEEPNEEYWQGLASEWNVDVETAKQQRCGNCAVFVVTTDMKNCIAQGIEQGGSSESDAWDAIGTAELGYCEAFDFKCAASRTCRAWVTGGPIDDNKAKE